MHDLRAALHLQGADVVHAALHDVLAGWGKLQTLPLEVLLVINCNLEGTQMHTCSMHMPHTHWCVYRRTHHWHHQARRDINKRCLSLSSAGSHLPWSQWVGIIQSHAIAYLSGDFTFSAESRKRHVYFDIHIQRQNNHTIDAPHPVPDGNMYTSALPGSGQSMYECMCDGGGDENESPFNIENVILYTSWVCSLKRPTCSCQQLLTNAQCCLFCQRTLGMPMHLRVWPRSIHLCGSAETAKTKDRGNVKSQWSAQGWKG